MIAKYMSGIKEKTINSFEYEFDDCEIYFENIQSCFIPQHPILPSKEYVAIKVKNNEYFIHKNDYNEFLKHFDIVHDELFIKSKYLIAKHYTTLHKDNYCEYIMDNGERITTKL